MRLRDLRMSGSLGLSVALVSLALSLCLVGMTSTAFAGLNPNAKVAIHVRAHSAKLGCTLASPIDSCGDIVTTEPSFSFDAFPVFFDLTEYTGCELGMTWPAWSYSAAFTSCSDFVIGEITQPGDGSSHTWSDCHTGVAVPCFIWLYADGPGFVCPTIHPGTGAISALDCSYEIDNATALFCAGVYGATGDDPCVVPALCQVTPTTLNFGTVTVGQFADLSFVLKNIGGGTLEGTIDEACADFSLVSGGGAYALAGGDSVVVVVRFAPATAGGANCTIETGTDCANVDCSGTGENPPLCAVDPVSLDFGTVTIGQFSGRTFTIKNTGGGTLTGDVTEACDQFSITTNGGPFSLAADESVVVGVRFTPTTAGPAECTIDTGQEICSNVSCTGTGALAPSCDVQPTAIDVGRVFVGSFKDTSFTITNVGGGTLTGTPSEACPEFDIVSGGDTYALGNGQSVEVVVRFTPTVSGAVECGVDAGASCDSVYFSALGELPPQCQVEPTIFEFGTVTIGDYADRTFTLKNIGEGTLAGSVTEACDEFSLFSGGGAYSLAAGESVEVVVRFTPTAAGVANCTVETGTE
jgi:hypothetical protein